MQIHYFALQRLLRELCFMHCFSTDSGAFWGCRIDCWTARMHSLKYLFLKHSCIRWEAFEIHTSNNLQRMCFTTCKFVCKPLQNMTIEVYWISRGMKFISAWFYSWDLLDNQIIDIKYILRNFEITMFVKKSVHKHQSWKSKILLFNSRRIENKKRKSLLSNFRKQLIYTSRY